MRCRNGTSGSSRTDLRRQGRSRRPDRLFVSTNSFMPDLYLCANGTPIGMDGVPTANGQRAAAGDFIDLSHDPFHNLDHGVYAT